MARQQHGNPNLRPFRGQTVLCKPLRPAEMLAHGEGTIDWVVKKGNDVSVLTSEPTAAVEAIVYPTNFSSKFS